MTFAFYADKLDFTGPCTLTAFNYYQSYYGSATCSCTNKLIMFSYDYQSGSNYNWQNWNAGETYVLTFSVGSISGFSGTDMLFVTMTYTWQEVVYYNAGQVGSCDCNTNACCAPPDYYDCADNYPDIYDGCSQGQYDAGYVVDPSNLWYCCLYYCCSENYYSYWYYNFGTRVITGKNIAPNYAPYYSPTASFFSGGASGDLISQTYNAET